MLVLSRKESQTLYIGDNIEVLVIQARDGTARLGITAPREVRVCRDKDYQKKKEAQ